MDNSDEINGETIFDHTLRSHHVNLCGSCMCTVGITKIGYTSSKPYIEWFISLSNSIPYVCSKCSFFICDECRTVETKCPEPCNGDYDKYKIF